MISKPWLLLPAKWAHTVAPIFLPMLAKILGKGTPHWRPYQKGSLHFPNRLGLAGGVDKKGDQLLAWQALGAGFLEVGTITPLPQGPNAGQIIDRDLSQNALWNKMGFPNAGADEALKKIQKIRSELKVPLFINIGKNRNTLNTNAIEDYELVAKKLSPIADAIVINISSPNTQGLRELQTSAWIEELFQRVQKQMIKPLPIFIKLSPDLESHDLTDLLTTGTRCGAAGFILTNTTQFRDSKSKFPKEGGVSGAPLRPLSEHTLVKAVEILGPPSEKRPILISVGGIMAVEDIKKRFDLGADLVQCYSVLVLEGPNFFQKVAAEKW